MASNTNPFGRSIKKEEAQRMYKNFYKIKKRSIGKMKGALNEDCESLRYHGGLYDDNGCSFLDMAFVFDAKTLKEMLSPTDGKPAPDGIILFMGSRDKEDCLVKFTNTHTGLSTEEYNDVDGRPTVLVFPFAYQDGKQPLEGNLNSANLVISLDDGLEHPGTGGGGGTPGTTVKPQPDDIELPIPGELPTSFAVHDVHHYFFGTTMPGK